MAIRSHTTAIRSHTTAIRRLGDRTSHEDAFDPDAMSRCVRHEHDAAVRDVAIIPYT